MSDEQCIDRVGSSREAISLVGLFTHRQPRSVGLVARTCRAPRLCCRRLRRSANQAELRSSIPERDLTRWFCRCALHSRFVSHGRSVAEAECSRTGLYQPLMRLEARHARLGLRCKPAPLEQLAFQRGEEALAHRVVIGSPTDPIDGRRRPPGNDCRTPRTCIGYPGRCDGLPRPDAFGRSPFPTRR